MLLPFTSSQAALHSPTALGGQNTHLLKINSSAQLIQNLQQLARYNLMGQKISGAQKGINIIVYSDGSSKKVLVK